VTTERPTLAEVQRWPATVAVEDSARAFGCSRSTAYAAIAAGTFPAVVIKVNRRLRVLTASIVATLEGHGGRAA